jgi:alkylation response protein AidB-like acyl-CoA dehydrogenase
MTVPAPLAAIDTLGPGFQARARALDEAESFPYENFKELAEAGLLNLTLAEKWGGQGLWSGSRYVAYYEILERLATYDSSTAQLLQVHAHALGICSLLATEEQAAKYLRPIAQAGQLVASVGSESKPTAVGGGMYASELTPLPDGPDGGPDRRWRLTCEKHFASLGPGADWLLIWVAVPGEAEYAERTVVLLVARDAPEVELIDEWDVMGMRSTVSWGVKITDYEVPADAVFGQPGDWRHTDPRTFTLGFTANHVGSAQAALDFAAGWVRARPHLASSELIQLMLGELAADVFAARSALYAAARLWEPAERGEAAETGEAADTDSAELASLQALHIAKRTVLETTRKAFEICGARSAFRLFPLERMYRDARTFTLHFRDEEYSRDIGAALIAGAFSGKGRIAGSK